jgi:hypothetical protein
MSIKMQYPDRIVALSRYRIKYMRIPYCLDTWFSRGSLLQVLVGQDGSGVTQAKSAVGSCGNPTKRRLECSEVRLAVVPVCLSLLKHLSASMTRLTEQMNKSLLCFGLFSQSMFYDL